MKYLKAEEILAIHSDIIDETGGAHGIRDVGLFASIIEKPKASFGGKETYPGIFMKAAAYMEAVIQYHVFLDGNKRTGVMSAARFLFINGRILTATNKELEDFVVKVAVHNLSLEEIALWLKENSEEA